MTFKEFERKLKRNRAFEKYLFALFSLFLISFSAYMLFNVRYNERRLLLIIVFNSLFILFGLYALIISLKIDKFTIIKNELTKEQNAEILRAAILKYSGALMKSNHTVYIHRQNNIWKTPFEIRLYADNGFMAVNVITNYRRGIVDFGKAVRQRNKIVKLFKEQSASVNYKA